MTQTPPGGPSTLTKLYSERIWPSAWVFVSTALVIPASLLVFLPINLFAGVIVAIVLYAALANSWPVGRGCRCTSSRG
jgi:hypothetical protein